MLVRPELDSTPMVRVAEDPPLARLAVLYSRLSGYMAACLKALRDIYSTELLVVSEPPSSNAPFSDNHFDWIDHRYSKPELDRGELSGLLADHRPDAVLMSGWYDRDYLAVAREVRRRGVPVIAGSDAQWKGSMRQQIARVIAPRYLHTAIDVLWVAGERQRSLAAALGYGADRCWSGIYSCDWPQFAAAFDAGEVSRRDAFLFVGRYVPVKGIDVLMDAYDRYRRMVDHPWNLVCAGSGADSSLLQDREGVTDLGFTQPDALPGIFERAGAFVLPSRKEPWGVVLHEAAAAGLPLVASDACGAAVHLLSDGFNGYLFEAGNADHLAQCLARISNLREEERRQMSRASHTLSLQFTPDRWASTLVQGLLVLK